MESDHHKQPTDEGVRRYPTTDGYHRSMRIEGEVPDHDYPCTCTPLCEKRCAGECGCDACGLAFHVFCEDLPLITPEGCFDEARGLRAYRDGIY
jgi:hypothetical protein